LTLKHLTGLIGIPYNAATKITLLTLQAREPRDSAFPRAINCKVCKDLRRHTVNFSFEHWKAVIVWLQSSLKDSISIEK
jgi:hypothetical protein